MHKPFLLGKLQKDGTKEDYDDFVHRDRLAKVLMLYSQGYSQSEIAQKLKVNQSTVSRDLDDIKKMPEVH